jgi:hypothetical protein
MEIDKSYADVEAGALSTISDKPIDLVTSPSGALLMLMEGGAVAQWDAGTFYRPFAWESAELEFSGELTPTSIRAKTHGTLFKIIGVDTGTEFAREIVNEKPVRLKRLGRQRRYKMGFYGTWAVEFAELGTANSTLSQGV